MNNTVVNIVHDTSAHYFKVEIDNHCAYLVYANIDDKTIDLYRTFVPDSMRGMGIAAKLTQSALDYAEQQDFKVIPTCSYVEKYMQKNGLLLK